MLDTFRHQASGLGATLHGPSARLVTLTGHGDKATDFALLWRLCLSWSNMGYPVSVLDTTAWETGSAPGLEQLLDQGYSPRDASYDALAWNVYAAARGMDDLLQRSGAQARSRLRHLFADDAVVVVYANAETLTRIATDENCQPLMVMASTPEALLKSYVALKKLLISGEMSPLMVDATGGPHSGKISTVNTLIDCARNFLDHELQCIALQQDDQDMTEGSGVQRLALRILENAIPLSISCAPMHAGRAKISDWHNSRNH